METKPRTMFHMRLYWLESLGFSSIHNFQIFDIKYCIFAKYLLDHNCKLFCTLPNSFCLLTLISVLKSIHCSIGKRNVMHHSRSQQRTDQRVLVLTLKFLALKKWVFPRKNYLPFCLTFFYLFLCNFLSADATIFSKKIYSWKHTKTGLKSCS